MFYDATPELDLTKLMSDWDTAKASVLGSPPDGEGSERRRMSEISHVLVGALGVLIVIAVWRDLIDTVVTTRHGHRFSAARKYFELTWRWYSSFGKRIDDPAARERFLVPYGPVSLVGLLAVWVAFLVFGWGLVWWGFQNHIDGIDGVVSAIYFSGVTFLTIGYGDIVPQGDLTRHPRRRGGPQRDPHDGARDRTPADPVRCVLAPRGEAPHPRHASRIR